MNPLTQVRQIKKINETELKLGIAGERKSWHDVYKNSAWVFVGGLSFDLTEGDVISVFSQYGEVVNMNLVRDPKTGKSRGFAFICYEDQRSTILAVDNLNGIKLTGRTIRVDHVANYKPPKEKDETDELTRLIYERGCGPEISIDQLQKEAAKREVRRALEGKSGEKRNFGDKFGRRRDSDRREPPIGEVTVEYDDDGDVRPSRVKVEYDDDGDIRRGPPSKVEVEYGEDAGIRRGPPVKREINEDGDMPSTKRRSIEPTSAKRRDSSSPRQHSDDRSRPDHRDRSPPSNSKPQRSHHHYH